MAYIAKRLGIFLLSTFSLLLTVTCKNQRVLYTGYEAHRFFPQTDQHLKILKNLETNNPGVLFLKQPGNKERPVDILFAPHLQFDALPSLQNEMPNSLISNDMEALMEHDAHVAQLSTMGEDFSFNGYWDYPKLTKFCEKMAKDHADIVKMEQYGRTSENRSQIAMVIAKNHTVDKKPVMVLDAGTHAREWITVMSGAYFFRSILTNRNLYKAVLDNFVLVYAPCINPDGFAYTWSTDRLWRKNRSPNEENILCPGTDPNRNYDFGWSLNGSSTDPCSEVFCGSKPFSIEETENFRKYLSTKRVVSYTSLHSYSQMVLLSYGCRKEEESYPEFQSDSEMAKNATNALKGVHGTEYQSGNSDDILYPACGTSADYYKKQGSRYAWTYELRDTGDTGFILPAKQIAPTCEETEMSLRTLHNNMANEILKTQAQGAKKGASSKLKQTKGSKTKTKKQAKQSHSRH